MADCRSFLTEKYGLSTEDADAIVREVEAMSKAPGGGRDSTRAKRYAQATAEDLDAQAAYERKAALLQMQSETARSTQIEATGRDRFEGVEAATVGTTARAGAGALDSTASRMLNRANRALSALIVELEGALGNARAVSRMAWDAPFNLDLTREIWRGADGSTGNEMAQQAAQIVMRHKDAALEAANRAGAFIRHLPGHVFAQRHNPIKLRKAGKDAWVAEILPLLDKERTFRGSPPEQHEAILAEIWENIVTGTRAGSEGGEFAGTSLAARLSRDRVLHFAGPDEFTAYNGKFGDRPALGSIFDNLQRLSRDTALMEDWGPDPDRLFRKLLAKYEREITNRAPSRILPGRFRRGTRSLENNWLHLTGHANHPVNASWAQLSQGLRNFEHLTKMGGVTVTSISDLHHVANVLRMNGVSLTEGYLRGLAGFAPDSPAKKRALRQMGFAIDAVRADIAARFSAVDEVPGTLARAANWMFKANGLRFWTDALDGGTAWFLNTNLAGAVARPFEQVNPRLQRALALYGIGEGDWKALSEALEEIPGERGLSVIAPERIADKATADRFFAYIQNEVDTAVPKPGARERALFLGGTRPGSLEGEILRMLAQYKMFTLTVMTKTWPRWRDGGLPGALNLLFGMAMLGFASLAIRDVISGKAPPDPMSMESWYAALMRGGGAGIVGDLLLQDFGRYGRSPAEIAIGPVTGTAGDLLRILNGAVRGDADAAEAFRVAMRNMPFGNLFYTKAAVDYLWTWNITEALNPGYLRRMERRMKTEGRGFWLDPQDVRWAY